MVLRLWAPSAARLGAAARPAGRCAAADALADFVDIAAGDGPQASAHAADPNSPKRAVAKPQVTTLRMVLSPLDRTVTHSSPNSIAALG